MRRKRIIQVFLSAAIVGLLVFLWIKPSDLAYNISQQRDILLGRYTVDYTVMLLFVTPVLLLLLFSIWPKKHPKTSVQKKLRAFKTISLIMAIVPTIAFADVAMRLIQRQQYVGQADSYHRAPNQVFRGVFKDVPEAAFSYPGPLRGYGEVEFTLTVDSQGFRNGAVPEQCDWVVLGDSFAEGSKVSDEQIWPVLFAQERNVSIYNLGMSGGSPVTYLDTLRKFGLKLRPKTVIYLLYEGNDLRSSNFSTLKVQDPQKKSLFGLLFKSSPLRRSFKTGIVRLFAHVGSKRFCNDHDISKTSHPLYPVSWMPFEVPVGGGNFYAFDLKRLLQHFYTEEQFAKSLACTETLRLMSETKQVCDENNIRFVVVFAPDSAHLLADYMCQTVSAEQIYAYMSLKEDDLPQTQQLKNVLLERTNVQERAIENFCEKSGITFISLTEPLKRATIDGVQTYYTYDQHWTPEGHKVASSVLAEKIQ